MPRSTPFRTILTYLGVAVLAVLVGRAVLQYGQRGVDFQWDAAYLLLHGQNPYTATIEQQVVEPRLLPISALYFPSALALLIPYALLPYEVARWVWLLSNLGFTAGSVYLLFPIFLGRRGAWHEWVVMVLLLVGSSPWATGMGIGQHAMFALFFFLLAFWFAIHHRHGWAGVALAVAALKYVLVVPLALYFVYKKWYRAVAVALAIHLGLHIWASFHLRVSPLELLMQPIALSQLTHNLGGYVDLIALQRYMGYLIPALADGLSWWGIGSLIILGVLTGGAVWRRNRNDSLYLVTLCWLGLIALYHPLYDLVILVIPLFLLLYRPKDFDPASRTLGLVGIGALFFLNRFITVAVTLIPPDVAAGLARVVLILLFGIYYAVAVRWVVVLLTTDTFKESNPLFTSSQGGV
jgi:hypothetical protein